MAVHRRPIAAFFAALLSVTSVVSAIPLQTRQSGGLSNGFRLIARVVESDGKELSVPIDGAALQGAHVGAGLNTAVLNATSPGTIFYQNGTAEEVGANQSTILSDGGTPLTPYGIHININTTDATLPVALAINGGIGTPGVTLTAPDQRPGNLEYDTAIFIACDETLAYYGPSWHFAVVKAFETTKSPNPIPENCVLVNFVPQCATLSDLPEGSLSSHEFANEVRCTEDA
ncbi:hypothetical protein M426DRAFT_96108 [Hypoxylon sp. CI-4A]|nr:hypothetical protein M426DRAFT_96108 [Hypoxylon sp. CI-4A]